jgi:hypothetical protein
MKLSRHQLALGLAFLLPAASIILLAIPPWHDWFPHTQNIGLPWLIVTAAAGGVGILLLSLKAWQKLVALIFYVPLTFLVLAYLGFMIACIVRRACL